MTKKLYIIITHTPSVVSKIIGGFTHTPYNHVSISLDTELDRMYSFGRRYKYFPWWGGFVRESPNFGTLGRFPQTEAIVLALDVEEEKFDEISRRLEDMLAHKELYDYDTLGLMLAFIGKRYKRSRHYYCSEFVRELLVECGVEDGASFNEIVTPMDFLGLPSTREIYRGNLKEFAARSKSV